MSVLTSVENGCHDWNAVMFRHMDVASLGNYARTCKESYAQVQEFAEQFFKELKVKLEKGWMLERLMPDRVFLTPLQKIKLICDRLGTKVTLDKLIISVDAIQHFPSP